MINVLVVLIFQISCPVHKGYSPDHTIHGFLVRPDTAIQCTHPMTDQEFQEEYDKVKKMSFEDSKLTVSKQILNKYCISVKQIATISRLFYFTETKIEWMKFCYGKTADKKNYSSLEKEFTDPLDIQELKNFIKMKEAN